MPNISNAKGRNSVNIFYAFASGNAAYIADALGIIARARGMTEIVREAGVTRERLTNRSATTAIRD